jgi:hypothetical protein
MMISLETNNTKQREMIVMSNHTELKEFKAFKALVQELTKLTKTANELLDLTAKMVVLQKRGMENGEIAKKLAELGVSPLEVDLMSSILEYASNNRGKCLVDYALSIRVEKEGKLN